MKKKTYPKPSLYIHAPCVHDLPRVFLMEMGVSTPAEQAAMVEKIGLVRSRTDPTVSSRVVRLREVTPSPPLSIPCSSTHAETQLTKTEQIAETRLNNPEEAFMLTTRGCDD